MSSSCPEDEVLYLPRGIEVYEIDGPFFFGVATKFDEIMREIGDDANVRIIRMRKVPFIDSTGLYNLETLCQSANKEKIQIILSGVIDSVHQKLNKSEIPELIGEENICPNIHLAVERAVIVNKEISEKNRRKLKRL